MITFATFFLGLIIGTVPVDVAVDERVAAVEYFLDDALVARIEAPPWRAEVAFGDGLEPHELLAVSYDAEGAELGRAHQWINLSRPLAEGHILLDGGEGGRGVTARVIWGSVASETPSAARVVFDGRELAVQDPRQFTLPDHDPERLHYLRAELEFDGNVFSAIDLTFGGGFIDHAESHEMAVPIALADGARGDSAEELQGRFAVDGKPLRVLAVEKGPAEVVLVRDKAVQPLLDEAAPGPDLRYVASLKKDQVVRFLEPFARVDPRTGIDYELFPRSGELSGHGGGLLWHLVTVRPSSQALDRQRLAEAVGVAGIMASARSRRRAVVLVIGDRPADASHLAPSTVRGYLEALRVPLFVWSLGELSQETQARWGPARDVSTHARLESATGELARSLDRQRIVWLEGMHLPQRVTIAGGEPSVALAR